jgi:hypothetical protein
MDRRKLFVALLPLASLPTAFLFPKDHDKDHGKGKKNRDDEENDHDSRYFRRKDYRTIEYYYNGPRNLPPGLRKKYYRTGTLPPGWEKKMQPFPPELVLRLPPPPPNCERGYIDGIAVVYDRKTRIILDSIDLVSAITGH